jgi:hypothetical protein
VSSVHPSPLSSTPLPLQFKHTRENLKIQYPFRPAVRTITMIAVGVGIAPMIQAFHELFRPSACGETISPHSPPPLTCSAAPLPSVSGDDTQVCLLYGVRTVPDILLREQLEEWARLFPHRFRIVYCVGSRWAGVHMAAKVQRSLVSSPLLTALSPAFVEEGGAPAAPSPSRL